MRAFRRILIALLALALPALAAAEHPPVKVYLDDEGPGVSQAKEAQRLLELFRKELAGRKTLSLVESSEEADVRLVVREAEVFYERAGQVKAKRGGFRSPTTGRKQLQIESEQELGVEVDARREPVLVVRLHSGDTFVDFANHSSDRTLKAAARDVAEDIDRWLKRRSGR